MCDEYQENKYICHYCRGKNLDIRRCAKINKLDEEIAYTAIKQAKQHLENDPHLANYILRDLNMIRDSGQYNLVWSLHKGTPYKEDVEGVIKHLLTYLQKVAEAQLP